MKKTLAALAVGAAGLLAGLAAPASATVITPPGSGGLTGCASVSGWYVNPDESDRKPESAEKGLKFEGADLVHHKATGVTTENLSPGDYTLAAGSGMPDQSSFFSVEVMDSDGSGYATLRWNKQTTKWDMVTGGQLYSNANPTTLVNLKQKSHNVISFGVGYTKNPPGNVVVTIKAVQFQGAAYNLECPIVRPSKPVESDVPPGRPNQSQSPKPGPSATFPPSDSPTPSDSESPGAIIIGVAANGGSSLPVTGPGVGTFAIVGAALIGTGSALAFFLRRRKVTFSG